MVQIKIENRHNNEEALQIINEKIHNLKEKVQCLQQYVPKLLKKQNDSVATTDFARMKEEGGVRRSQQKKILDIVKDIAKALVEYTKNKKKFAPDSKFTLKSHQKVRIEDLL